MKWKELRAFLNTKFDSEDHISLAVDYNTGDTLIIKSKDYSGANRSLTLVDWTISDSNQGDTKCLETEYTENEISKYFSGFERRNK